jgi:lysophospholipase L1-like esterase
LPPLPPESPRTNEGELQRFRLRRIALAALFVASLAGNVVLVSAWIREVRKGQVARLDPAGLGVHAAERGNPPPAGRPVLVLFGDSRAAMWPTPVALTEFTVVNRGVGYQTTAQIALRIDADVAPLRPAIVVLEAGVNDLKTIADLPEQRSRIIADCKANLRLIVERCGAIGANVVVLSVFDIGDVPVWRQPFWSEDVRAAIREVNAFLPTLTSQHVVLLDAGGVLDDDRGRIRPAYQVDYLHLLPAAYEALDTRLLPVVRGLPLPASPAP